VNVFIAAVAGTPRAMMLAWLSLAGAYTDDSGRSMLRPPIDTWVQKLQQMPARRIQKNDLTAEPFTTAPDWFSRLCQKLAVDSRRFNHMFPLLFVHAVVTQHAENPSTHWFKSSGHDLFPLAPVYLSEIPPPLNDVLIYQFESVVQDVRFVQHSDLTAWCSSVRCGMFTLQELATKYEHAFFQAKRKRTRGGNLEASLVSFLNPVKKSKILSK